MSITETPIIHGREYSLRMSEQGYHFVCWLLKQHQEQDIAGLLLDSLCCQKAKIDAMYADIEARGNTRG